MLLAILIPIHPSCFWLGQRSRYSHVLYSWFHRQWTGLNQETSLHRVQSDLDIHLAIYGVECFPLLFGWGNVVLVNCFGRPTNHCLTHGLEASIYKHLFVSLQWKGSKASLYFLTLRSTWVCYVQNSFSDCLQQPCHSQRSTSSVRLSSGPSRGF